MLNRIESSSKLLARFTSRMFVSGSFSQHVFSTLITQVISIVILIANTAIVARWLGVEGKGIHELALMLPAILGLVFNGGIGVANVYYAGSRKLDVTALTANSMAFAFITLPIGLAVVGGLFITGWLEKLLPGVPNWVLLPVTLAFPIELLLGHFNSILQGNQLIPSINAIRLGRSVLMLALTVVLVIGINLGLLGALLSPLLSGMVALTVTMLLLQRRGGIFLPHWDLKVMRTTLKFGIKGYVANLLQYFNYRLDIFLVNFFLGPASVGIYSVSVRLAELLWQLPNAVGFVIFPKAAATQSAVMNRLTPRVTGLVLLISIFGALGLALIGPFLIWLIYSESFLGAYVPMIVLLPGVVLLGGTKVLANEIAGRSYPQYNSIISGATLIITIGLDLLLIPIYGVVGAALASSIAYTVTFGMVIWFYIVVSKKGL